MKAAKRILCPTDFSPAAGPAFEFALESAKRDGATLLLAFVVEPLNALADEAYVAWKREAQEAMEAAARKEFDGLLARAKAMGVDARDLMLYGWAPEEILKAAATQGADLIVMGTNGRTGLRRLMLGSVAEHVITHATCPVVTLRAA